MAEDWDDPVEEPTEQNPFCEEVIQAWRRDHGRTGTTRTKGRTKTKKDETNVIQLLAQRMTRVKLQQYYSLTLTFQLLRSQH
jgi:hypothetical protein